MVYERDFGEDNVKNIYLDSTLFSNAAINPQPDGDFARAIMAKLPTFSCISSIFSVHEASLVIQHRFGNKPAISALKHMFNLPVSFLPLDQSTMDRYVQIAQQYNCGIRVALHAASAISNNVSAVISEDPRFKLIRGLDYFDFKSASRNLK